MSIVTRGLGGGDLVTGGLGSEAADDPGSMSALLVGAGTVTAALSFTSGDAPSGGWGWTQHHLDLLRQQQHAAARTTVDMSAALYGSAHVEATATTTERPLTGFDDLALLLTLELV